MKKCILVSGGVDSFIGWHYLGKPDPIYVNVGNTAAKVESDIVDVLYGKIRELSMPFLGKFEKPDFDIPGRNLYLAMVAANLGYDEIALIVQKDETSIPDRKKVFFEEASKLLSEVYELKIVIDTPFWDMDKEEMVRWYLSNRSDLTSLLYTFACYQPVLNEEIKDIEMWEHCGNCGACFRRFVAFTLNGLVEPWYKKVFASDTCKMYKQRCLDNYYSPERCEKTLRAIKIYEDMETIEDAYRE